MFLGYPTDDDIECVVATLPGAPRILARLASALQNLEADIEDVTQIVRHDSGLATRLIDVANGAAFSGYEPATSIEDAIARLGFSETCHLIGTLAAHQLSDRPLANYGISASLLRENSLFCAVLVEELADVVAMDAGTAYTVGLLRSVGKVVLDRLPRRTGSSAVFDPRVDRLNAWERDNWGTTNAEIAARALRFWRFPEEAIAAVRDQYAPTAGPAFLLNWAAGAAQEQGHGLPGERGFWCPIETAAEQLGARQELLTFALDRARTVVGRVAPAFA